MRVGIISLIHESNTFISTPTTIDMFRRDGLLTGPQMTERFAGGYHEISGFLQGLDEARVPFRLMLVDSQYRTALVAEHEFEQPVLRGLESRRLAEYVPEFGIFSGRQGIEHLPLAVQLILDVSHACQFLDRLRQLVLAEVAYAAVHFVDDELDPELGDLVLDDKQHLVMVRRITESLLSRQQLVELQVSRVIVVARQVRMYALFEFAFFHRGHNSAPSRRLLQM